MSRKKVMILGKLPPPYIGPSVATSILLKSELRNKFELIHLDTKTNHSITSFGKWEFGKVFATISIYLKMIYLLIAKKPDLVLIPISQTATGFIKDSFFILIARIVNKKILVQLRGSNFKKWVTGSPKIIQRYVKFILKSTQGVVVLGNNLKYIFFDYFNDDKIFVVPNGADYILSEKVKNSNAEIKILYLSNLLESKGVEDVFEAVAILNKNLKNKFSVDFIGEWLSADTKKKCMGIMQNKQLPIRVHSSQVSREKFRFLSDADIFVFPPREPEGHPWSILEAMAAGLPVISTNQGAITESVIDGTNGFIVEPKHPEQIAEKIKILIENTDLRIQMGNKSRTIYLENFTEKKMVEKLSAAFNAIIN